jgi:hypothetical protein
MRSMYTNNDKRSFSSGPLMFHQTQPLPFIQEELYVLVVTGHHQAINTSYKRGKNVIYGFPIYGFLLCGSHGFTVIVIYRIYRPIRRTGP